MVTQSRLKDLLRYDPETGEWTWRVARANVPAGTLAACVNAAGYVVIRIDGKLYSGHRLAFLWMTGEWPAHQVDHIDLDKTNNRWGNLRQATDHLNRLNVHVYANNKSRLKGVSFHRLSGKWMARIQINGRQVSLGYHDDPQTAHAEYARAARKHFGEFARTA